MSFGLRCSTLPRVPSRPSSPVRPGVRPKGNRSTGQVPHTFSCTTLSRRQGGDRRPPLRLSTTEYNVPRDLPRDDPRPYLYFVLPLNTLRVEESRVLILPRPETLVSSPDTRVLATVGDEETPRLDGVRLDSLPLRVPPLPDVPSTFVPGRGRTRKCLPL